MSDMSSLRFILHVSDFHLRDDATEVRAVLSTLTQELKAKKFKVDYLVHTGDVIDSSDLFNRVARDLYIEEPFWGIEIDEETGESGENFQYERYQKAARKNTEDGKGLRPDINDLKEFDGKVADYVNTRFELAEKVMRDFVTGLNVAFGNVIVCSGNHDVLRPLSADKNDAACEKEKDGGWRYTPSAAAGTVNKAFRGFLKSLGTANSTGRCKGSPGCAGEDTPECVRCGGTAFCALDDLNVLILNTNWANPANQRPGYYCVNCRQVLETIRRHSKDAKEPSDPDKLSVIVAHKPIYEICEKVRLPFKRYTKTPFFSAIQRFLGKDGIYLCGDKHTRSIVASLFHDIPHYIGGEPIRVKEGHTSEVEYNLLAISNGQVDMKRKLHLSNSGGNWKCEIRPQDQTVKALYKISWKYISQYSFNSLGNAEVFPTWESLCQVVYNWTEEERLGWYADIDRLYAPICRYRINGVPDSTAGLPETGIFSFVQGRIIEQMKNQSAKNVLNIRGEHSGGKSRFLGQFYIHLMTEYSKGSFNFIPAYFNMENTDIYRQIESGTTYHDAVKEAFKAFVGEVQEQAEQEHQPVCYLIDGLDELDCWSYSTEDSVGRELLNTLAKYNNAWYIMSFSQHDLPGFKNTMPLRKYNDASDIMYFNPVDVNELAGAVEPTGGGRESAGQFTNFVTAYLQCRHFPPENPGEVLPAKDGKPVSLDRTALMDGVCETVRAFRRLTINPGFLQQNDAYLTEIDWKEGTLRHGGENVSALYNYYIDRQNQLCLDELGYGFIDYAPAMAFLFTYKGYTYERFQRLRQTGVQGDQHILQPIYDNSQKIYHTFLFIMKNKDAREYLIALHYNRELRYYAEHPKEEIEKGSILNEFITRNIAVLTRKMWTDTNKFVIACKHLLRRKDLGNCAQSMLIYCLAHLRMYEPIRSRLQEAMYEKGRETLKSQGLWDDRADREDESADRELARKSLWRATGNNAAEKLECFRRLSLKHSMEIFGLTGRQDPQRWKEKYENNPDFWIYNRQHQMLYYGDLSIKNDANIHALIPGSDLVYAGFDFHDCFNYLYVKLTAGRSYPLRFYDLLTMCDLLISRLRCERTVPYLEKKDTFFYRNKDRERAAAVLSQVKDILKKYPDAEDADQREACRDMCGYFEEAIKQAVTAAEDPEGKESPGSGRRRP